MNLNSVKAQKALAIAKILKSNGHQVLFAGGCVRDFLMCQEPQDFDLATTAKPEDVERLFAKTIAVGKQFGVMLVMEGEDCFEVATFRQEGRYRDGRHPDEIRFTSPQEDALRRDFTVNGLFFDPFEGQVLDYVAGQEDIKRRVIRAIGDPLQRFEEDKLRLLRAVRFASTLNFEIDRPTWDALCRMAGEITVVSPERIRDELIKILTRPEASLRAA
jgi:poly(A) polymerase